MAALSSGFFADRFGIDANIMNDILAVALSRGGDYADLFFEHHQTSAIMFEEQAGKQGDAGVLHGVGIRVRNGDAAGYADSEDLTPQAMRQAADTAAKIPSRRDRVGPVSVTP